MTRAHLKLSDFDDMVRNGTLEVDGKIVVRTPTDWINQNRAASAAAKTARSEDDEANKHVEHAAFDAGVELNVSKAAIDPVWNLPEIARRFGVSEGTLRCVVPSLLLVLVVVVVVAVVAVVVISTRLTRSSSSSLQSVLVRGVRRRPPRAAYPSRHQDVPAADRWQHGLHRASSLPISAADGNQLIEKSLTPFSFSLPLLLPPSPSSPPSTHPTPSSPSSPSRPLVAVRQPGPHRQPRNRDHRARPRRVQRLGRLQLGRVHVQALLDVRHRGGCQVRAARRCRHRRLLPVRSLSLSLSLLPVSVHSKLTCDAPLAARRVVRSARSSSTSCTTRASARVTTPPTTSAGRPTSPASRVRLASSPPLYATLRVLLESRACRR